ncbi:MAG: site-2 protease family protein [Myxococcota bacterium]
MHFMNLAGIPIRLHWSFLALFAGFAGWALLTGGVSAFVTTVVVGVALFTSVLLHELGHALAARHYGIGTDNITLYPFGGIASITGMPRSARQELVIAIAGPAVNGALFLAGALLWGALGWRVLLTVAALNLMMGLFNLIPAFPMDGGRVLRAALATRMGWFRASDLAMRIGKAFAWAFLAIGIVTFSPGLILVSGFLHVAIASERRRLVWEWAYARDSAGYRHFRFT